MKEKNQNKSISSNWKRMFLSQLNTNKQLNNTKSSKGLTVHLVFHCE